MLCPAHSHRPNKHLPPNVKGQISEFRPNNPTADTDANQAGKFGIQVAGQRHP